MRHLCFLTCCQIELWIVQVRRQLLFVPEAMLLWAEQHDKSDTDSDKEGDKMYDDMMTHEQIQQMFNEESDDEAFLNKYC